MSGAAIPEGWELVKLSEVGKFQGGSGFPLNAQGKTSGIYPFFKVSDFSNDGNERSLNRANHYIDEDDRRRIGARIFPAGTIAFAKIGAAIFLERKRLIEQESCLDNNMAGYILNDSRVSRDLVLANLFQFSLGSLVASTALPAIGSGELNGISFLMPSSADEQQAIAAALSDADGVVAGLERVIAKKRLIKQGAMQDLLTARRRLPGFSGEWVQVQLKDFTTHGAGNSGLIKGTLQRSGRTGIYPAYTASGPDLMLDFYEQEGDAIIISAVGSRCGKSFRASGQWSSIANTHVLRCREGLDIDFAFIFLNNEDFWLKGGTGQPFVLVRRTLEKPFLLPSEKEQRAIAEVFNDIDAEIQTLESRLTKARAVKEGMMQNLLTGRVRLV